MISWPNLEYEELEIKDKKGKKKNKEKDMLIQR